MARIPKRIVLTTDNELWRKTHPVLLDIYCRGAEKAWPSRMVSVALLAIAMTPVMFLMTVARRAIHLAVLVLTIARN